MAHPTNVELLLEEAVEVFSRKKSSKSIGRQTWQPHKGRMKKASLQLSWNSSSTYCILAISRTWFLVSSMFIEIEES